MSSAAKKISSNPGVLKTARLCQLRCDGGAYLCRQLQIPDETASGRSRRSGCGRLISVYPDERTFLDPLGLRAALYVRKTW
jgi:hypothetical protein